MSESLDWPLEATCPVEDQLRWSQPGSNLCLDFHGDPITAGLAVFSDGNHHMALEASMQAFRQHHPEVVDIFYATTPPSVIVNLLRHGQLVLGNLSLSRLPNVFISPPGILDRLQAEGYIDNHQVFMQSRGNVLLVRKGNPKNIRDITDLLRDDVRLFLSNPVSEKASYEVYEQTLLGLADDSSKAGLRDLLAGKHERLIYGERIHHREAPQCIYDDRADVAVVYYHLALRYTRIFPTQFELVPLAGLDAGAQPDTRNITTNYHIGLLGDGGKWGQKFLDFMFSDTVTQLYTEHGLQRN